MSKSVAFAACDPRVVCEIELGVRFRGLGLGKLQEENTVIMTNASTSLKHYSSEYTPMHPMHFYMSLYPLLLSLDPMNLQRALHVKQLALP